MVQGIFTRFLVETGRDNGHLDLDAQVRKAKEQPFLRLGYHLGLLLRGREGGLPDAVELLRLCAKTLPDDVSVRRAFAETLLVAEEWAEAEQEARATLELAPDDAEAWRCLGFAQEVQGNMLDAIGSYEHAIVAAPKNELAAFALGSLLVEVGRIPDGIPHLRRAVELQPDNEEFVNALKAVAP